MQSSTPYSPMSSMYAKAKGCSGSAKIGHVRALTIGLPTVTVVNNRAGGNANEITRRVLEQLELLTF